MSPQNAAQIVALVERARAELGAQILAEPARLTGFLTQQAPHFAPQIKALGGALALGAITRIGAAADPGAEASRIAGDVVMLEAVTEADARVGAAIAAQLAGRPVPVPAFGPAAEPVASGNSWVGATEVPAAPATAAPQAVTAGAQVDGLMKKLPPALQNKWVLGGIAALAVLLLVNRQEQQQPAPQPEQRPQQGQPRQQQPQPQQPQQQAPQPIQRPGTLGGGPAAPPGDGGLRAEDFQLLVDPSTNLPPPQIAFRERENALLYAFAVSGAGGVPYFAVLMQDKRAPLWQRASLTVMTAGAQQPENISAPGAFQLGRQQNTTMRQLQITNWDRNGLNLSDVCVVAFRPNVQDLGPRSFNMCVLTNNCTNMVGCGVVP